MSHVQQSSLADTVKTLLSGCYEFSCTRSLLHPSVRNCPIKLQCFFPVNLQISHLTCWIRIANVFTWLEILSSMWGLRIPQRQDLHAVTSPSVLKSSSVTWAVTKPWGGVWIPVSISSTRLCTHADQTGLTAGLGSGPSSGLSCPTANTACTSHLLNACWKLLQRITNSNYFRL